MKRIVSAVLAMVTVMAISIPAFAMDQEKNKKGTYSSVEYVEDKAIYIPHGTKISIEKGETIYLDFYDEENDYYYDFYNSNNQTYFRWKDYDNDQNVSPLREDAKRVVYRRYEFNCISYPVSGKDYDNTFEIGTFAAHINGTSYLYNYQTGACDYSNQSAEFTVKVVQFKLIEKNVYTKKVSSNTSFDESFTAESGGTYYVEIVPKNVPSGYRLKGSGEVYAYI